MSLTDQAYSVLKSQIISGKIAPGSHIDAIAIAEEIGVSKTPVREAILRLSNEGVVEPNGRRGFKIVPISASDLNEIYQVITALEVEAVAEITSKKPSRKDLNLLIEQIIRMRTAVETEDPIAWSTADEAFHRGLATLSGNNHLVEACNHYRDIAQRAHFVALRQVSNEQKAKSTESHFDIIDVMVSGNVSDARSLHRAQRERGRELLVTSLRKIGVDQF